MLSKAREKARRVNCAGNLKQIGLSLLMYSGDFDGFFPNKNTTTANVNFDPLVTQNYIQDGKVVRNAQVRLLRDNVVVYEGKMSSLRRFKDDMKEVATGYECGIGLENYNDIKVGDIIEAYEIEKIATKL